MKRLLPILLLTLILPAILSAQHNWTDAEIKNYKKMQSFCEYLSAGKYDGTKRKHVSENYVLAKKSPTKKDEQFYDGLIVMLQHFIDSVGLTNLDMKPIKFYQHDSIFYKPFADELEWAVPTTFAYYIKKQPEKPIGHILFDPESGKIASWILLNMGGSFIFLTPGLY